MREVSTETIKQAVKSGFQEICIKQDKKLLCKIDEIKKSEEKMPSFALEIIEKNAEIAERTSSPLCQDTGMCIVFLEVGQDVKLTGQFVGDAINEGVRECYVENYFRKSVLSPLTRIISDDNTPAVIHYEMATGDKVKLSIMAKGFGSENMSKTYMLYPAAGIEGVKDAIVNAATTCGSKPCPPIIVGVGIGGTMEKAAILSKKALFRDLDSVNKDPILAEIENDTLTRINEIGCGVQGLGGKNTALKVLCEQYPTHLAGLPVAVTIQCYCSRHKTIEL